MTLLSITGYDLANAHGQAPGVSVLALIAESHCSVHTWPQEGIITMDLYSCRPFPPKKVMDSLNIWFETTETLVYEVVQRYGVLAEVPE
jgi:S-adenosylmethionine/arginine decarboxylase-like enzyme